MLELLFILTCTAIAGTPACPLNTELLERFNASGTTWLACEDLQRRDGALALVSEGGTAQWFEKGYEPYTQGPDTNYYLGLPKEEVMHASQDVLALALLKNVSLLTYVAVRRAVPPMVHTGIRAFVGSRSASVDTTFSDMGEDGTGYGFPPTARYVINLTAIHAGEPPIEDFLKHVNTSYVADGLVGGHLPIVRFSFPISTTSPYLPPNATGVRHWDMIAAASPDMRGSREQQVFFRFQQVHCAEGGGPCALLGRPLYFDTYWWSNSPDGRTELTGPQQSASASGFYATLLEVRRWWEADPARYRYVV